MPTKSSAATTTTTTTTATVLDSSKDESINREEERNTQTSKVEKHKIIYDKKAESEFFVDNSALAGFTGERILYMAIRELIENSLDSCESFSILPSINVSLKIYDQTNDLWILSCEDNGTGINSEKLPVAVCSFLTSAKYMEKQQRGLFGVGLKMVAAFSTKDTDFPIRVWNRSIEESEEYLFELRTDIGTNKPIVLSKKLLKSHDAHIKSTSGFKIEVILRAKLVPITKSKIYEYVSETSIVNPYASITFETDDGIFHFDRRTSIMPHPAQEILPHPSDMDLKTLKKALSKFHGQKMSLPKILSSSFQKLSYEKAKDIVTNAGLTIKPTTGGDFSEHDLIKVVNICKKTRFQNPNTDHLSPIGEDVLTIGMMSEYTIVSSKSNDAVLNEKVGSQNPINNLEPENIAASTASTASITAEIQTDVTNKTLSQKEQSFQDHPQSQPQENLSTATSIASTASTAAATTTPKNSASKSNFSVKVLKPVLTTYTSRTCVINNRPTIVETGLAYGGDIPSFKMYRFANKIPLLYDEGSDVAREVISEVEINKMGITKKQAKEQFSMNKESKKDRVIEVLPLHIFFHICSTKIPYKTAGKESIASEGELKYYMKSCLSELYRKLSTQIRKELKLKEAENKLRLYKHYLPFIVNSINESLGIKNSKLNESFSILIENHLSKKPLIDESDISPTSSSPSSLSSSTEASVASVSSPSQPPSSPTPPSSSFSSISDGNSPSPSSPSLTPTSTSTSSRISSSKESVVSPRGLHSQISRQIKPADVKKNPILKVKEQQRERENSISKYRFGNNNNIEKKKIIPQSSRQSDKKNHLDVIIKSHKQNVKTNQQTQEKQKQQQQPQHKKNKIILEKKSMTPTTTTTITTTNKKNGSDVLKGDVKIKVQDSSNKIDKRRGIRSEVKRRGEGGGRGTELKNITKIPPPPSTSPHLPQSKQIQSTMDSFSKRVNKGKRK